MELLDIYDDNGNKTGRIIERGDKSVKLSKNEHIAISVIFIENDKPNFIIIDNKYKCETIESMINLREKTLKFSNFCDNRVLNKIKYNLIRLKKWKQLQH